MESTKDNKTTKDTATNTGYRQNPKTNKGTKNSTTNRLESTKDYKTTKDPSSNCYLYITSTNYIITNENTKANASTKDSTSNTDLFATNSSTNCWRWMGSCKNHRSTKSTIEWMCS